MFVSILRRSASLLLVFATLLLIAAYPLATLLPQQWGYENQQVENAQVALLSAALLVASIIALRSSSNSRWFGLAAAPILLILVGRELSWGAVLLDPAMVTDHGPYFTSEGLPYKPLVAPVAGGLIFISAIVIACSPLLRMGGRVLKSGKLPLSSLLIAVASICVGNSAEGHFALLPLQAFLDFGVAQVIEELAELSVYGAMISCLFSLMAEFEEFRGTAADLRSPLAGFFERAVESLSGRHGK